MIRILKFFGAIAAIVRYYLLGGSKKVVKNMPVDTETSFEEPDDDDNNGITVIEEGNETRIVDNTSKNHTVGNSKETEDAKARREKAAKKAKNKAKGKRKNRKKNWVH